MIKLIGLFLLATQAYAGQSTFIKGPTLIESLSGYSADGTDEVLTKDTPTNLVFTGSVTEDVFLPDATTVPEGRRFRMQNQATVDLVIKDDGGTALRTLPADVSLEMILTDNSTSDGVWAIDTAASVAVDQGAVPYGNALSNGLSFNQNVFYFDDVNEFLGIGTNTPAEQLHVVGNIRSDTLAPGGALVADANGTIAVESPLSVANGGTNSTASLTGNKLIVSDGTSIKEHVSLTQGQLVFPDVDGLPTGDTDLFYDGSNDRLGLKTNSPNETLDVLGSVAVRYADVPTTGNIDALNTFQISAIRLTGAGTVTLRGIDHGNDGKELTISNVTGNILTIANQDSNPTASRRIITGTGAQIQIQDGASVKLKYDATTLRWRVVGGVGSGSGGVVNLITENPDIEKNATTGFSLGNVSIDSTTKYPSGAPTFGSGASGNLSLAVESAAPLNGSYSLNYVSSAATTQGNFVATDAFSVPEKYRAKPMRAILSFRVSSGTGDFSGTLSNSFGVAVYDVTNSAWVPAPGTFSMVQSSGVGTATVDLQTSATGSVYRMILYNANATAGAITLTLDDFTLTDTPVVRGVPASDWEEYTPTFQGFGTVSGIDVAWRRVGDTVEIRGVFTAGTVTGTEARIGLPSGLVTDSSLPTLSTVGAWSRSVDNGNEKTTLVEPSVSYFTFGYGFTGIWSALSKRNGSDIVGNGETISVFGKAKIQGWSSNVVFSSDTAVNVVAASVTIANAQSIPTATATKILFDTVGTNKGDIVDLVNSKIKIKVPGPYRFSGAVNYSPTTATYEGDVRLYRNGSLYRYRSFSKNGSANGAADVPFDFVIDAVPGQEFELYTAHGSASTETIRGDASAPGLTVLNVEKISGHATIAASEDVYAVVKMSASQTGLVASDYVVNYDTIEESSHGWFDTTTKAFTAHTPGLYSVYAQVQVSGTDDGSFYRIRTRKNSSARRESYYYDQGSNADQTLSITDLVYLNEGDVLDITIGSSDSSWSISSGLGGGLEWSYLNIHKVSR